MAASHTIRLCPWFILFWLGAFQPGSPCAFGQDQPPDPPPPSALKAVPPVDELVAADKAIRAEFKAQYEKKKTADVVELAKLLRARAEEHKPDEAAWYVLVREAGNLFAAAGELPAAFAAVDTLARRYSVPAADLKTALWRDAWHKAARTEDFERVFRAGLQLLAVLRDEERFDPAEKLAANLRSYLLNVKDPLLLAEAKAPLDPAKIVECSRAGAALARLKAEPKDRNASLTAAQYFAFTRNNWARALPLFVQGSDAGLAEAARLDVALPQDAAGRTKVGDAWWKAGQKEAGAARAALCGRAGDWYRQALADLPENQRAALTEKLAGLAKAQAGLVRLIKMGPKKGGIQFVGITPAGHAGLVISGVEYVCVDLESGNVLHRAPVPLGLKCAAFSPDGHALAYPCGSDGEIRVVDALTGQPLKSFKEPTLYPKGLAFNREGQLLLAGMSIETSAVLTKNLHTGNTVASKFKHAWTGEISWSHDLSKVLDSVSTMLLDSGTGATIRKLSKNTKGATDANTSFSFDDNWVAWGSPWGPKDNVQVLDVALGTVVRTIRLRAGADLMKLDWPVFLPDNRRIAICCGDNAIRIWDFQADQEVVKLECGNHFPARPAVSHDGRLLLTADREGDIRLFSLPR